MPGFEVIDEKEKKAICRIFDEGKVFFAHGFDKKRKHYHVREFEQKLKNIFSPKMADVLCVSSGTAAIKVALKALGIGRGDEVITQSFNFIATVEAIVDTGANVVFTDIDDTLNMCPKNLESLISKKTKAIIPVHMLGVPADMILINRIGKRNKIPIKSGVKLNAGTSVDPLALLIKASALAETPAPLALRTARLCAALSKLNRTQLRATLN